MMMHQWRGVTRDHHKKAHGDLIMVFGHKMVHIKLAPLNRAAKLEDVEIVGAEI